MDQFLLQTSLFRQFDVLHSFGCRQTPDGTEQYWSFQGAYSVANPSHYFYLPPTKQFDGFFIVFGRVLL